MTDPKTRRPLPRGAIVATLVAAVALALGGCGDDGDDEATDAGSSTTTEATTTTEASTSESSASTETTTTTEGSSTEGTTGSTVGEAGLAPGDPCSLDEGIPDCIDPDGDGEGVYLIGGAACLATAPDPLACEDSDGDGVAGTTDEYADLPTCGEDVPPPCNNPPGSSEESGPAGDDTTTSTTEPQG